MKYIMTKGEIKDALGTLRKVRNHCDNTNCKDCDFIGNENSCIFFNKPWEWELGIIEEKL